MKQIIKKALLTLMAVPLLSLGAGSAVLVTNAAAADCQDSAASGLDTSNPDKVGTNGPDSGACSVKTGSQNTSFVQTIKLVINIMLFIIGLIAVVMLVIGGIRYATSGGSSEAVKGAKDTILYAIIGIVVAVMAYAVVGFVTQNISQSDNSTALSGTAVKVN